ncbi:DUF421 domain-containing protein [Sediminibacillus halophilus]|uniref:Uncharacterized membrane protein YcaP, DUF421 family n=1 Tax=Sediminibacillus halophilus TaxID=482461 RepID=A0A1G9SW14_9BACI|nr:DUF421 domain-containing protein [Sediminibacillus halophilus]SDM39621.1 Uncharacterized membrane protein YcaP, DUF421 family [Sediminibacillus halophilus]
MNLDFQFVFRSVILVLSGILLLRISGRKSISQMTLAQTVVMISIGSVIIQPIVERSVIRTIIVAAIFVFTLIVIEWLQLKFNVVEKFITGKSKIVIQNGQLEIKNLNKNRLTVDQLEMFLRQQGISNLSAIKTATIEPNGQLGYELKEDARPLTVGEFKKMIHPSMLNPAVMDSTQQPKQSSQQNLFEEITANHQTDHSKKLK